MELVIDTSVALASCFQDERNHRSAKSVLARLSVFPEVVPALFWSEVRNGLLVAERLQRIKEGSFDSYLSHLRDLGLGIDTDQVDLDVLSIASEHGLTGYDAEYLEIAMRREAQLATFDKKLLSAAKREGVAFDLEDHPTVD